MAISETSKSSAPQTDKQKLLSRKKSFNNCSSTLKRKAKDLSAQCKSQVCIVSYNGSYDKGIQVWPEDQTAARDIIMKYTEAVNKKRSRSCNQDLNLADYLNPKKKMKLDSGKNCGEALDKLSGEALKDLSSFVNSTLHKLDQKLEGYKSELIDQPYYISNWNPLELNENSSDTEMFKGFNDGQYTMVPGQAFQYPISLGVLIVRLMIIIVLMFIIHGGFCSPVILETWTSSVQWGRSRRTTVLTKLLSTTFLLPLILRIAPTMLLLLFCKDIWFFYSMYWHGRSGTSPVDSFLGFEAVEPNNFSLKDITLPWNEQNNMNLLLYQSHHYDGSSIVPC